MKNKAHIYLSILLFTFIFSSTAQELGVFWGKEFPAKFNSTISILGRRGPTLIGYKWQGSTLSLVKFSSDGLQPTSEVILKGRKGGEDAIPRDYRFEGFVSLKNKMYILVSRYDAKTTSVYVQEIGIEGRLDGQLKKLAEISSKSRSNSGSFNYYTSKDSTKFVIVINPPFEKYAGEKFGFNVYDQNLKEEGRIQIELPYMDKNFSTSGYLLSNDGTIFMLARIDLEKKAKKEKKKEGESAYYYEIISIDTKGKGSVSEYDLKLPKKEIVDVSFSLDENKGILCSGFYGDIEQKGRKRDDINGLFYLRINKETKMVDASSTKALDKDFIADLTSKKQADKGRGISSEFEIREFLKRSDGGALIIAEYAYDYTVTTTTTSNGVTTTRTTYHYLRNNILAININPDGTIKWYTNIPKYQHTTDDGGVYSSFMLMTKEDKMFFVFNDNPRNMDATKVKTADDMRTMSNPSKSVAVIVELSESGEFSKKQLFSNKENKTILMPTTGIKTAKHEYVAASLQPGFVCCLIPFKTPKMKLARFEFN